MFYSVVFLFLIVSTQAFLFGKSVYPDWDQLSVTFPKYSSVPMSEENAIKDGWKKNGDGCLPGQADYKGKRYSLNGEMATMVLFDHKGRVAGMQMALPNTFKIPKNQPNVVLKDGNKYLLTAYFTNPDNICSGNRATTKGYVGDKLFLRMNSGIIEIPLKESNIAKSGQKWTLGKCFFGMGQHYWYNTSRNMDCEDMVPFFLLYNGGNLNAFGFAAFGNLISSRVEHPTSRVFPFVFQEIPKCFEMYPGLTTQHIFLQRRPYLNFC